MQYMNVLDEKVCTYKITKSRVLLDEIVNDTNKLIYVFGKRYKKVPSTEYNFIFGVALMKALNTWNKDGQASFTTYLSTIIINEFKMILRRKQYHFETCVLQESEKHPFEDIIEDKDNLNVIIYEDIVNDVIKRFKEPTQMAIKMYLDGHKIENVVKELKIGRTNFYTDLKQFKNVLGEELDYAKINLQ